MSDRSLPRTPSSHAAWQMRQTCAQRQTSPIALSSWPGGLLTGAVHDIVGGDVIVGFSALLLANTTPAPIVWAGDRSDLYPPGLCWCALDPARLILAEATQEADRLGALETALRGGMHGVAMVENVSRLAARRLALAARSGGGVGLVLRSRMANDSTAFAARWRISPARSGPNDATRFRAELLYGRGRLPGVYLIEADRHATPPALALVSERHAGVPALRYGTR